MRILLTGGSGFIGSHLSEYLLGQGDEVVFLQRKSPTEGSSLFWDPKRGILDEQSIEGFDAVINLAGESLVTGRLTGSKKKRVRESRIEATRLLTDTIARLKKPPEVFISASAIGFYGPRDEDEFVDEESSVGSGFLAELCQEWEEAALVLKKPETRVICLRIGMVLANDGGALKQMLPAFRLGLGGRLGSGKQWVSWIALADLVRLIAFLLTHRECSGIFNAVAPCPVTNEVFTYTLAKILRRPAFCRLPGWLLRLLLGEIADELLLVGARVVPKRTLEAGFMFHYPEFNHCLTEILL